MADMADIADMADGGIRMPDTSRLVISSSPHFHSIASIQSIMFTVVVALVPAALAGIWHFGLRALWIMAVTTVSALAWEILADRAMGRECTVGDGTAVLTGLLLAMNLPPAVPEWVCVIGAFIAIVLGKMVYGGMGNNPFNPALVGRVALLLAVPSIMTDFSSPCGIGAWCGASQGTSTATPLALNLPSGGGPAVGYLDLFLGRHGGCIGETCFLAILIGGVFLICLNLIRWQVPVFFIGTVALVTGVAHAWAPGTFAPPLAHVLSGGLGLGAFFMATDMVTTPLSRKGYIVFAIGCGLITSVIRLWGSYPEGVSFSILIMNALTPLIDRATAGHPFGTMRYSPKEAGK